MKTGIQILDNFLMYLFLKNYSKTTIYEYTINLKIFFKFIIDYFEWDIEMKDINIFFLKKVTKVDIINFIYYLAEYRNNSYDTRERTFAAIRSFYNWLYAKYWTTLKDTTNPTNAIDIRTDKTFRMPKYLTLNEGLQIQNIFNKRNSRNYKRNNTIIALFLNTGIRLSELVNINISDIDFNKKIIKDVKCKGNIKRIILINDKTIKVLKEYLNTRNDNEKALFLSDRKNRISTRTIERICEEAYRLMGLENRHYTVHTLRHTFAIQMHKKTKDILLVKELLGHKSINSTEIYTHITNEAIKRAVDSNPLNII